MKDYKSICLLAMIVLLTCFVKYTILIVPVFAFHAMLENADAEIWKSLARKLFG